MVCVEVTGVTVRGTRGKGGVSLGFPCGDVASSCCEQLFLVEGDLKAGDKLNF